METKQPPNSYSLEERMLRAENEIKQLHRRLSNHINKIREENLIDKLTEGMHHDDEKFFKNGPPY